MAYVRIFNSQIDPAQIDEARKTFEAEVKPLFERLDGCQSVELLVATEPNAGGLLEGSILARWESPEAIDRAYERDDVRSAAGHMLDVLRQEPVIRLYEVIA